MSDDYSRGDVGLHNPSGLVQGDTAYAGAGFIESAYTLDKAVDENNKVGIGIGSAGMALETLGLVLDPIGSVLAAGIGWLIEHISILRWPLDLMWGDPVGIEAAEEAIQAEKAKLEQWSADHGKAVEDLMQSWSGDAADEFRRNMNAVTEQLNSLGGYVDSAAKQMKIAGGIVGAFRGIVRDMISMLLATIIKGALIAAALAPVTFGASIAIFIGTTIGAVAVAIGKIGAKIAQLTSKLGQLASSVGNLGKAGDDFAAAGAAAGSAAKTAPSPSGGGSPSTPKPGTGDPPKVNGGDGGGAGKPETGTPPPATPKPDDNTPPPATPAPTPPPSPTGSVSGTLDGDAPSTPKPDDSTPGPSTPGGGGSQGSPPPDSGNPPGSQNTDNADSASTSGQNPNHNQSPSPSPDPAPDSKPIPDQVSAYIKERLSQQPGVTPEILEKFDKVSNFTTEQLGKLIGPDNVHRLETAVKAMTDPWFGKTGLAGKTIVDIIKGVPTAAAPAYEED